MEVRGIDDLRKQISKETCERKITILSCSLFNMLAAVTIGVFYALWSSNASKIQDKYIEISEERGEHADYVLYDVLWAYGPFTDKELAASYKNDLLSDTESEESLLQTGVRWTIIYKFGSYMLFMLALNSFVHAIGTYSLKARSISICCTCPLGCLNIAAIVTIAVFRFNTMGKLASLSLVKSSYDDLYPLTTISSSSFPSD